MGQPDFRVGGRIFATLASEKHGYGNLMLSPELQATFVAEQPSVFLPVPGGWGKNGVTHIRLADANEDVLGGALRTAWKLRIEKNERARTRPAHAAKRRSATPAEMEAAKMRKTELRARLTSPAALEGVKRRYGLED